MDDFDEEKIGIKSLSKINQSHTTSASNRIKSNNHANTPRNKKTKRLPWNTEVLTDRFTPQPYPVQLLDACTSFNNLNEFYGQRKNILIFMNNQEWCKYLQMMAIKQYALNLISDNLQSRKLILLVTNMSTDVAGYVELVSRHTTLMIAGIDTSHSESYCMQLKSEAQIMIMSVDMLVDWFKRSYLNASEIMLIIFVEASSAVRNDLYKHLIHTYLDLAIHTNILSFCTLDLHLTTSHDHVEQHIEHLKSVFKCSHVETATDLVDTHNLFNGIQLTESIQVFESVDLNTKKFQLCLLDMIRNTYSFIEDLGSTGEEIAYMNNLCVKVLNECVYLLNQVGVWCLAKSLLPIICQLDKLTTFFGNSNKEQTTAYEAGIKEGEELPILKDPDLKQELVLQFTATSLRNLRETCVEQFLSSKNSSRKASEARHSEIQIDLFLDNFCTPKVKNLIELLRTYKKTADEFCCMIFVQNKQVATSLSLLLKKLAKEDHMLNYIYPNYVIGHSQPLSTATTQPQSQQNNSPPNLDTIEPTSNDPNITTCSDSLKQEEILRKFYSGDINLLICTYEMEAHIMAPSCVNLIVRFDCDIDSASTESFFDYPTYIATKSRAQSKNASCVFFVQHTHFDLFFRQFIACKQIETKFITHYSRILSQFPQFKYQPSVLPVSGRDEAVLSLETAIRYINRYCIRLPSDALTQLTPRQLTITRKTETEEFKSIIYLPINSGLRQPIHSDWQPSAALAQQSVAYKACLLLSRQKELNDMLEPVTKEMFYRLSHVSDADDEYEWKQFSSYFQKQQASAQNPSSLQQQISSYIAHRPGGAKRKQIYTKRVSPYLGSLQLITVQHPVYLYIFHSTLTTPLPSSDFDAPTTTSPPNKSDRTACFGLISSKILLETSDFPIFTCDGEETISCQLLKSNVYLTPNQLKLIKAFHRFLFSNTLRMEGLGAVPLPFLSGQPTTTKQQSAISQGCLVAVFTPLTHELDWELMKKVENCTDRSFLRVPDYTRFVSDEASDDSKLIEETPQKRATFKFISEDYTDAVVVPFYRNSESIPQFYCVTAIDSKQSPVSPFPVSNTKINAVHYETFHQYFAIKYGILITDLNQPLLVVSHPSTRLNLLTPRYMNMKASVIQRTFHQPHPKSFVNQSISERAKLSSNKIFLVPELVNIHPFSATVLRRSLCIPSILYRLNSLLVVEELRREIARSTGVGMPWFSETQKFEKLTFDWDKNKEIEISEHPDLETDVTMISQQKRAESDTAAIKTTNPDPNWNFEISQWDETVIHEQINKKPYLDFNFEPKNLRNLLLSSENGWHDEEAPKTLFIDPSDMEFFDDVDEFSESEDEALFNRYNTISKNVAKESGDMLANKQQNHDKTMSSHNSSANSDDADMEAGTQFQFTIDINKLRADIKKKSAKLLAKLSVNTSDCNLVKDLVKVREVTVKPSIAIDLESFLNSSSNYKAISDDFFGQKNGQKIVKSCFIETNEMNGEYEAVGEMVSLNEWFDHVQLKFNLKCLNNQEKENVLANIRKKLLLPSKSADRIYKPIATSASESALNYQKLSLPIIIDNIRDFFQKNPEPSGNTATNNTKIQIEASTGTTATSFRNTDWSFDFKLDDIDKDSVIGPGPELLLQALTMANAVDGFDLERLETVGDSFLKQAITVYLFFAYPNVHEGKLSYLRSKQVSNYNLYKLGKRKFLQELIVSNKFEPLDSWLPPHYDSVTSINKATTAQPASSASLILSSLLSINKNDQNAGAHKFDKYKEHILSDKSIADSMEAIIGAYLITSGPKAALQVMSWFGLKVLPKVKCEDGSEVLINIPEIPRPVISDPLKLHQMLDGYASFEACIGYKFKQPAYLLQAFTHASYVYNTLTDCYQRLEFLGDAILDYVITRYLYEDKKRHSPGELTDLRSALVNNNIFAHLAVKYEFYKYFKYVSPVLFTIIDNFVCNQKKRNDEFDLDEDFFDFPIDEEDEEEFNLLNNSNGSHEDLLNKNESNKNKEDSESHNKPFLSQLHELEEMEVPKCLGDIFESVAGAIFLDSDRSFDTVWRVYYGLMKPQIDKFTATVPKSPIRELFELEPETAKFEKPERTISGKIRVTVSVFGRGKFKGVGRNYRIAKNAAAKLALKYLKNNKF